MSHFRIIFVITLLIIFLIITVHVRAVNSHKFYELRSTMVTQARLKQGLYHKKIKLEFLTNSRAVYTHLDKKVNIK